MKRRDFLSASAGVAGLSTLPTWAQAAVKPCPPGQLGVVGGTTINQACLAGDAEADWLARSTGPGVVWAHDFRYEAEFTQFFAAPYGDNGTVSRFVGDGITGGACLQYRIPKGIPDGHHYEYYDSVSGWIVRDGTGLSNPGVKNSNADWTWNPGTAPVAKGEWMRPFSALLAGSNGLPTDDAGASGSVARRAFDASASDNFYRWRTGYYGHASYHDKPWPTADGVAQQSPIWDGTEFFLQFRVRLSYWRGGERGLPATNAAKGMQFAKYPPGKLFMLGTTANTPLNVIVLRSEPIEPRQEATGSRLKLYTAQSYSLDLFKPRSGVGDVIQPGGVYDSTCYFGSTYAIRECWEWPYDEWVTVLIQVIPGRNNAGLAQVSTAGFNSAPYRDTGLRLWVARQGASEYTKIFDWVDDGRNNGMGFFFQNDGKHPPAWNAFMPSGYMNNAPSIAEWTQRFDQIIFSKQFIPCPRV